LIKEEEEEKKRDIESEGGRTSRTLMGEEGDRE
jgi:hypothetical protein